MRSNGKEEKHVDKMEGECTVMVKRGRGGKGNSIRSKTDKRESGANKERALGAEAKG